MFKDLRLAIKIGGGFACVLILAVATAIASVIGLSSVAASVSRGSQSKQIIAMINDGVIAGKNYVITSKPEYSDDVAEYMSSAGKIAEMLKGHVKDPANVGRLEDIEKAAKEYTQAVSQIVTLRTDAEKMRVKLADTGGQITSNLTEYVRKQGSSVGKEGYALLTLVAQTRLSGRTYMMLKTEEAYDATIRNIKESIQLATQLNSAGKTVLIESVISGFSDYSAIFNKLREIDSAEALTLAQAAGLAEASITKATEVSDSADRLLAGTIASTGMLVAIFTIIALMIGVVLSIAVTRSITRAMALGVAFTKQISDGNLEVSLEIDKRTKLEYWRMLCDP